MHSKVLIEDRNKETHTWQTFFQSYKFLFLNNKLALMLHQAMKDKMYKRTF